MVFKRKFKEKDEDKNKQSVSVGGPEGGSVSIESHPSKGAESGKESLTKQPESAGERQEAQQSEQRKQQPSQQKKKQTVKKKVIPQGPQVFGYKIPPQLSANTRQLRKYRDKGDPKTSIACLAIFADRLMRVHSN